MKQIRLIGLDLDGTLLDEKKLISKRTEQALQAAAQGVHLVPVTGRPHGGIPAKVREFPFIRYMISCNGAAIWDNGQDDFLRERLIPLQTSLELVQLLRKHKVLYEVLWRGKGYSEAWVYDYMISNSAKQSFMRQYIKDTRLVVPHLPSFVREQQAGLEELLVMAGSAERMGVLMRELREFQNLNFIFPAADILEITASGVDKGEALLHLAQHLGVQSHEVMALGDSGNDLAMLQAAGFPVAMGNAAPEVKAMARHTTASNEEHGVAEAIERFVLL